MIAVKTLSCLAQDERLRSLKHWRNLSTKQPIFEFLHIAKQAGYPHVIHLSPHITQQYCDPKIAITTKFIGIKNTQE